MLVPLCFMDAVKWYQEEVEKPLKSHNLPVYHPCCNMFTTKKAKSARASHKEHISFSVLFKHTVESKSQNKQVQDFIEKYLNLFGAMPEKNLPHVKKASEILEEEEQMESKEKLKKRYYSDSSPLDSRLDKDLDYSDDPKMKLEDKVLKRGTSSEVQLCKFRPGVFKIGSTSLKLIEENQRLSEELVQVRLEQAEQKKTLEAVRSMLETLLKVIPADLLGKREPLEDQVLGGQTTKVCFDEKSTSKSGSHRSYGGDRGHC